MEALTWVYHENQLVLCQLRRIVQAIDAILEIATGHLNMKKGLGAAAAFLI